MEEPQPNPANQTQRICTTTTSLHRLPSRASKRTRLNQGQDSVDHLMHPLYQSTRVPTNFTRYEPIGYRCSSGTNVLGPVESYVPDHARIVRPGGAWHGKTVASARTNQRIAGPIVEGVWKYHIHQLLASREPRGQVDELELDGGWRPNGKRPGSGTRPHTASFRINHPRKTNRGFARTSSFVFGLNG